MFVCENNQYMEYTPIGSVTAVERPAADRASAYGLEAVLADGNDPDEMFDMATILDREELGAGGGPSLIEALTYRHGGHSRADPGDLPAGRGSRARWKGPRSDPRCTGRGCWRTRAHPRSAAVRRCRSGRSRQDYEWAAVDEARTKRRLRSNLLPSIATQVWADGGSRHGGTDDLSGGGRLRALAQEMERDETVYLIGEDVAAAGWRSCSRPHPVSWRRFGPRRVRDTPISEEAIIGAVMGAAMNGLRPVAEIMFSDFLATCWDIVANQIAKTRYMTDGQVELPLVIRTANGGGLRFGAQHSQSVENWAMSVPGLKVVAPSTPRDLIELMAASIRDPDPVIFFEHKALYPTKGPVPTASWWASWARPRSCAQAPT